MATADPANPFVQIQTGEQHSQGFEADLTWQPARGLSFIASYAHVEAEVSKDNTIPVGNRLAQVPADSGRIWANYKFLDGPLTGFSVGAGVYAASDQAVGMNNKYFTPGYATVDAKIGYDINNWSFAINAKNLLNHQYYIPYRVSRRAGRSGNAAGGLRQHFLQILRNVRSQAPLGAVEMTEFFENKSMDRRRFAAVLAGALTAAGLARAMRPTAVSAHEGMERLPGAPLAMLLYPGFTALDLVAPHYAFSALMGPPVLLVAKTEGARGQRHWHGYRSHAYVSPNVRRI